MIDSGLIHYEASLSGFSERYRRGETPQTVHVWWARRPHTAMRALVYASLCKDTSSTALEQMAELTSCSNPDQSLIRDAIPNLQRGKEPPRVLDMFGGGGTIACESAFLGADSYSVDSNELSVFIQKCLLQYSQSGNANELSDSVRESGERVLENLEAMTSKLFPDRGKVFAYFWTYSTVCDSCGYRFLLSKRPWLSKKNGKRTAVVITTGETSQAAHIQEVASDFVSQSAWLGRNGTVGCPKCSAKSGVSIKDARDEMVAVASKMKVGKSFSNPTGKEWPGSKAISNFERTTLRRIGKTLPDSRLPQWSGIVNPSLYGIDTHADFLGKRQRAVLVALIACLKAEFSLFVEQNEREKGMAVIGLLAGLIDQLVDWNCRLSMWISQNEQVGRAFSGPGVPMLWDYVETDPVMDGPANLWKKLDRIVAGASALQDLRGVAHVSKAYAQELPFQNEFFDAIVTDPPYYDNIYYNALADFFFSWKRLLLSDLEPSLFTDAVTDGARELVASRFRSGTPKAAHDDYCRELAAAISEADRVLKRKGVFSLVYSHSSLNGWQAIVDAYRPTSLRVTSVQPLSIERKARPRAMTSEAVNTCVVFVSHKGSSEKKRVSLGTLSRTLANSVRQLANNLSDLGWNSSDVGVAAYAQGVGLLCNVSSVSGCEDDNEALRAFEEIVKEVVPEFRVSSRTSL